MNTIFTLTSQDGKIQCESLFTLSILHIITYSEKILFYNVFIIARLWSCLLRLMIYNEGFPLLNVILLDTGVIFNNNNITNNNNK